MEQVPSRSTVETEWGMTVISYIYGFLIFVYLIDQIFYSLFYSYLMGCLSVVILLFSVRKAGLLYRTVGLCFLFLGLLVWVMRVPASFEVLLHFNKLLDLLALFFVLPFMNAIIKLGKYDLTLSNLVTEKSANLGSLYYKTSFTTYILTVFLNVATVPVIVNALHKNIEPFGPSLKRSFFSQSILRASALVLFWSPTEILVAVTIDFTNQSYLSLLPFLFGVSFLFLLIDWWIHQPKLKKHPVTQHVKISHFTTFSFKKKLIELVVAVLCFIGIVVLLNQFLEQGFVFIVTIVVIPFSLAWALVLRKQKRFLKLGFLMVKDNGGQLHGLFFLFLCAGFFVEMIPHTSVFGYVQNLLVEVHQNLSLFFFFLLIGLFIFCLSLVGFHPLISIALIIPFLNGFVEELGLGISITMIAAALCTLMIGPFNVLPNLLALHLKVNTYRISRINLGFAFAFLLFNVFIAYIVS